MLLLPLLRLVHGLIPITNNTKDFTHITDLVIIAPHIIA